MFFNWHVTLRLAVFEIFAVKWSKFRPKISDLRIPGRYRPQKGRRSVRDRYVHRAKFHADRCHRRRNTCNRREKKTTTNRPFHTNVWRVIKVYKTVKLLSWNFQNKRATVLGFLAKLVKKSRSLGKKAEKDQWRYLANVDEARGRVLLWLTALIITFYWFSYVACVYVKFDESLHTYCRINECW